MNSTFYVWKENQEEYRAVEKKQQLINKLLRVYFDKHSGRKVEVPKVEQEKEFVPKPPDPETGYPCCTKARPCKHWQWDGNRSAYINSLTGKEREAAI